MKSRSAANPRAFASAHAAACSRLASPEPHHGGRTNSIQKCIRPGSATGRVPWSAGSTETYPAAAAPSSATRHHTPGVPIRASRTAAISAALGGRNRSPANDRYVPRPSAITAASAPESAAVAVRNTSASIRAGT